MSVINIIDVPVAHFPEVAATLLLNVFDIFSKYMTPHVKKVMSTAFPVAWLQECKSTAGKELQDFVKLDKQNGIRWLCST